MNTMTCHIYQTKAGNQKGRCDNKWCYNPSHLFLGTPKDNTADSIQKGRFRDSRGERNGNNKLTEKKAAKIKILYSEGGYSQPMLARKFGVSQPLVCAIVNHKRWKHVNA